MPGHEEPDSYNSCSLPWQGRKCPSIVARAVGETEKVFRGMFVAAEALENKDKIPGVLVNEYVAVLVAQRLHLSEEHARQHTTWEEGGIF